VRTLRNAIAQGRLAHAYLFVGPRGTGKTSTARIFAKALNNPSGPSIDFDPDDPILVEIAEGRSLDVLEIDGASNNGVEQVRQLRETVQYAPANCSFKIYYIDEVHMLSTAAFNALLKTLEEPPPHVKFIFATTEPNKILPTIISRCQRFDLRPIPTPIIAKQLLHIAKVEDVAIDDPAAWAIAKGAEGGMRDAQSMLDQLVAFCGETIRESDVQQIFGFTAGETIAALINRLLKKETAELLNELDALATSGKNLSQLLQELIGTLRALLIQKIDAKADREGLSKEVWDRLTALTSDLEGERLLALIDTLSSAEAGMRWATNKQLHLELALIKAAQTLDEIRISDVITALAKGGYSDENPPTLTPPTQTAAPEEKIATKAPPAAESAPQSTPESEPTPPDHEEPKTQPPAAKKDSLSAIDRLMQDAPDHREEEEEQPASPEKTASPAKDEKPAAKAETPPSDDFHNDPLIQDALEIFKGKLKK
jgi:DNA polymerase-3 subunit gamma/tau